MVQRYINPNNNTMGKKDNLKKFEMIKKLWILLTAAS